MADDDIQDVPSEAVSGDTPGDTPADTPAEAPAKKAAAKKSTAKKTAAKKTTAKKATAKKAAAYPSGEADETATTTDAEVEAAAGPVEAKPAKKTAAKKTAAKKTAAKKTTTKKAAAKPADDTDGTDAPAVPSDETPATEPAAAEETGTATMPLFKAPEKVTPAKRTRTRKAAAPKPVVEPEALLDDEEPAEEVAPVEETDEAAALAEAPETAETTETPDVEATEDSDESDDDDESDDSEAGDTGPRRRRRRGGRRRRRTGGGDSSDSSDSTDDADAAEGADGSADAAATEAKDDEGSATDDADSDGEGSGGTTRRRRKRRREGEDTGGDEPGTTTRVRRARSPEDEITSIAGSTRLEAKKQRRRDGREAGRRRAPIVSEAEFLARRESVDRVMVVRQRDELTQIGVLEDKVLVEHYVARESQTSLIGNIYLGRVQNVLPSMEAAFIDIGKGRNAVLYAGEVNWSQLGHKDGQPRKIESVLSSGQTILVQVSKDPVGHKGARLTSQISLAGRFLVYVPDGTTSGISRKLPDTERNRLKTLLKEVVPSTAGVIVRTAAEGASEEELTQDVERLKARWEEIESKAKGKSGNPQLLHGEPDLTLKVVRDLFTEDFAKLVIQGDDAWNLVHGYVSDMAPDLLERLEKYDVDEHNGVDLFAGYRVDEQIAKALDRKVFLPSGGSLVIDRTEAMTVVDVNTGKFTGSGGNLEETVTKNNLEAAEEVVRQLRLRDIGGIIVVDFIDMVLEANRDLVLRRMVECLGRDRTRHQVAEVTSLGLVQMTRKRIGTGLLESFSENCDHCQGRGVVIHDMPVEPRRGSSDEGGGGRGGNGGRDGSKDSSKDSGGGNNAGGNGNGGGGGKAADSGDGERRGRRRGGRGRGDDAPAPAPVAPAHKPSPAEFAAMAKAEVHREEAEAAAEAAARADAADAEATETTTETVAVEAPAPVEPVAQPAAQPVVEPEPTPVEPVQPAAPAEPKVITRSRRGVSRTVTTAPPAPVEVVVATPAPVAAPESAPEPPKVVTRTRGGARRGTVTPTPAAEPVSPAEPVSAAEPATEVDETDLHVPVKRKGAPRKR